MAHLDVVVSGHQRHRPAGAERLDVLERHVAMSPYVKEGVLDLLALPMWSPRRPKAWEHLPGAVDTLVTTIGG